MRVGRRRPLLDAGREALEAWFGAAIGEDRCIRVEADGVTPAALQRKARHALTHCNPQGKFDAARALRTARAALPRGTALLAIGDWYELDAALDRELAELGLASTVPRWSRAIPGTTDSRSGNGANARRGGRERPRVRWSARARRVCRRGATAGAGADGPIRTANWRTGVLREEDGVASLYAAFGLRRA